MIPNGKKETSYYIDTLFNYTLWYEFSNNFDAQSDFGKACPLEHSYLKFAS